MAMKLDHDDLDRLIEKISTSDIQEFSLEGEDFKLELKGMYLIRIKLLII